ncbi:uncharacterized protein LOC141668609 [Apium graveolens]|uniref:uncharacterized protein LOC141668609 n=1 Tax=Apium graveolens TaxID=4045 RepID=UPI003D7A2995
MEFCPTCGILVQFELPYMDRPGRLYCPACPYVCNIEPKVKIKRKHKLVTKQTDPVIENDDFKNAATTEAKCPQCGFGKAAYQQFQTRSADEPMTIFYWCMNEKCRARWRED